MRVLLLRRLAAESEFLLDIAATMVYSAGRGLGTDGDEVRPIANYSYPYLLLKELAASGAEAPAVSSLE